MVLCGLSDKFTYVAFVIGVDMAFWKHIFSIRKTDTQTIIEFFGFRFKLYKKQTVSFKQHNETNAKIDALIKKTNILEAKLRRNFQHSYLPQVSYKLVHHCNLNCQMCTSFAPLAKPYFADLDEFTRDMQQLAMLTKGYLPSIGLGGGEILLHPQMLDFVRVARSIFSSSSIWILSNGILLAEQKEIFWQTMQANAIKVYVTKYPIDVNYDQAEETARKYDVDFGYFGQQKEKTSFRYPIDLLGRQDALDAWLVCPHAGNHTPGYCVSLMHGRLFQCNIPTVVHHFNEYFGKNIQLSERDYLNIYTVKNMQEICDFISKPFPFCRYCNISKRTYNHPWKTSTRSIEEWTEL